MGISLCCPTVMAVELAFQTLGLPRDAVRSVVVFVGDVKSKTAVPANVTVVR